MTIRKFLGIWRLAMCLAAFWPTTTVLAIDLRGPPAPGVWLTQGDEDIVRARLQDPVFARGWEALRHGHLDEAYDTFSGMMRANPDDPEVNFALGLAARAKGRLSHAAMAFERIVSLRPANTRARLEAARTYYDMRQYAFAEDQFRKVLASHPPPEVEANIREYLKRIEQASNPFTMAASLTLGVVYDDNVNVGPSSGQIDIAPLQLGTLQLNSLGVDPASQPVARWGLLLAGDGTLRYAPHRWHGWSLQANAGASQLMYQQDSEYNLRSLSAMGTLQYVDERNWWDLPVRYMHLDRGNNSLVSAGGIYPGWTHALTTRLRAISNLGLELRDYNQQDYRDSRVYFGGETLRYSWNKPEDTIGLGVIGSREKTDNPDFANYSIQPRLDAQWSPWTRWLTYGQVNWQYLRYDRPEPLAPEPRRDREWTFSTGLRRQVGSHCTADVNYTRIVHDSTFGLYEYTRNVVTISTTLFF